MISADHFPGPAHQLSEACLLIGHLSLLPSESEAQLRPLGR